jgi:hypothetical protein
MSGSFWAAYNRVPLAQLSGENQKVLDALRELANPSDQKRFSSERKSENVVRVPVLMAIRTS